MIQDYPLPTSEPDPEMQAIRERLPEPAKYLGDYIRAMNMKTPFGVCVEVQWRTEPVKFMAEYFVEFRKSLYKSGNTKFWVWVCARDGRPYF